MRRVYTEEEARQRKRERQKDYERKTGYAAIKKYQAAHCKSISMRFFDKDMDIYNWIQQQENKSEYLKNLIRSDMERNGKNERN